MKELAEFRINEDFASMLFSDDEGRRLGSTVRKIELETSDPRFGEVGRLQDELLRTKGDSFYFGWRLRQVPSDRELQVARAHLFQITAVFEPTGEECGTRYDESSACLKCGSGARQIGPLLLDLKRLPKGKDVAKTIGGEVIVSRRTVALLRHNRIRGVEFLPICDKNGINAESQDWFQLVVPEANADVVAPTRVGINLFDDDREAQYRCQKGDLIGLNLTSSLSIRYSRENTEGFTLTRQYIGVRRGLLRPERLILTSPKICSLLLNAGIKGFRAEVAFVT